MPISIQEFWKAAVESRLFSPARAKELHAGFVGLKGAQAQANVASLAEWLIAHRAVTRYQASVLATGRAGPFVLGEYVIDDRIESGRLAGVYRAIHNGGRRMLLIFASQITDDPGRYDELAETAQLLGAIDSPHVRVVERFVSAGANSFLVLPDLAGHTVCESLTQQRAPAQEACRIAFQAGLGLLAIHNAQCLHGDLRPDNVWIDSSGSVSLLYFPLVTTPGEARGQLAQADYQAPELHHPDSVPDRLTDIYSLGATIYELIAGRVMFPGGSIDEKLARHESEIPQRLDQITPGTPEPLARLVAEMLDKEPLLRCQSVAQVVHSLAPLTAGAGGGDGVPPAVNAQAIQPVPIRVAPPAPDAPAANSPSIARVKSSETPPSRPSDASGPAAKSAPIAASKPPGVPVGQMAPPAPTNPGRSNASTAPSKPSRKKVAPLPSTSAGVAAREKTRNDTPIRARELTVAKTADEHLPQDQFDFATPFALPGDMPRLKPQRPSKSTHLIVAAVVSVVAAVVLVGLLFSSGQPEASSHAVKTVANTITTEQPSAQTENTHDAKAVIDAPSHTPPDSNTTRKAKTTATSIDDDGETLWTSPTTGQPLELKYLPSGAQVFLILRPADLLATEEGGKLFDALGPAGEWSRAQLRAILGVELPEVEQLTIAFSPDDGGSPQAAFVMRLRNAIPVAKLLEAWGQPKETRVGDKQFFQAARFAYYLPPQTGESVVAIAPAAQMKEMLEIEGPPLVRKGIERLLHESDDERHFNLLLTPSYLLTDGKSLLAGDLEKLRNPLAQFLDESLEAVLLSAHLGDALFLEFRALGPVDQPPGELAKLLRARLEHIPEQVEAYLAVLQPRPYGRLVVNRFPRMVQLLSDFTRAGAEGRNAVLRCYLPGVAAHNLLLGAELTLFEEPTVGGPAEVKKPATATGPAGAAAALQKRTSLSFPRDTLEKCLEMLSKEIDAEVVILGKDLQLEGITKNQSFGLDERDQVAGEILRKVLLLANSDGKLVYVIKPKEGEGEAIFITTRAAAAKRGDRLPAEFSGKSP